MCVNTDNLPRVVTWKWNGRYHLIVSPAAWPMHHHATHTDGTGNKFLVLRQLRLPTKKGLIAHYLLCNLSVNKGVACLLAHSHGVCLLYRGELAYFRSVGHSKSARLYSVGHSERTIGQSCRVFRDTFGNTWMPRRVWTHTRNLTSAVHIYVVWLPYTGFSVV